MKKELQKSKREIFRDAVRPVLAYNVPIETIYELVQVSCAVTKQGSGLMFDEIRDLLNKEVKIKTIHMKHTSELLDMLTTDDLDAETKAIVKLEILNRTSE